MINVIIHGHTGRLAKKVISNLENDYSVKYVGFIDRSYDFDILKKTNNVVILEISSDEGCKNLISKLFDAKLFFPLLIGTTGNLPDHLIKEYSKHAPVYIVSNFSHGMRSLLNVIDKIKIPDCTISIYETHHTHKKDAPSGTSKSLANKINVHHDKIESIREGDVFGIHEICFDNNFEKIIIRHEVKDPNVFAQGCIGFIKHIADHDIGLTIF